MNLKNIAAVAGFALVGISAPAMAQEVGDTVYGPQGGEVGTIEQVVDGNVVLNTGNLTATLPVSVLGVGENGPVIGWAKADLEAAVTAAEDAAAAKLEAALVVGAAVQTADPLPLGTIDIIEDGNVVLIREDESKVTLPKGIFALDAAGNVVARITMAELEEALSAQAGA